MIGGLLRRFIGGAPAAPPSALSEALPEVLELAPGGEVRVVMPQVANGYAALVNTFQGYFIFNHYDTGVGWQLRSFNAYEVEQTRVLDRMARAAPPDPVILDIGANIGVFTLLFAKIAGLGGLVHAYEAQRVMFHMLAGSMALNSMDNVHCHHLAVGAHAGTARLPRLNYRSDAGFGSVELNREHQSDAKQQAIGGIFDEVPMASIDALALPRVDMMKIDVEGMEAEVLAGAMQTILAQHPLIYLEYLKGDKQALGRTLQEAGYVLFEVPENFICVPVGHPGMQTLSEGMTPWAAG
ncbi:MAG TPA: FkbM family methyltransferase [Burkholderiales bacterium]|jgi:FkbM family methyltransferase|nr:FkbM family methyltransferase [Burkholderiales bacterium]